ncbi:MULTISPECIES: Flp family type IVb pilin [unclassified Dietzia]|uniref:Flp family type IVb pilin n=1 Tax=unclassified Dietzia TaxID=2617939 RepID=UPI0015FB064B|nr:MULTISPECIES: Flp family type IVb pilin [unclassified Dietzia]MBB1040791.1 Flp family type IVb pilin [Dietzia sp. Cai40]MBB1044483.1 Flp family type IVb pilin [Dietzia sp. DQ11-44]
MSQVATYFFTLFALAGERLDDRKDRGATAVEYGLMVGLIAIVIIVAVTALGGQLNTLFETVQARLTGVNAGAGA